MADRLTATKREVSANSTTQRGCTTFAARFSKIHYPLTENPLLFKCRNRDVWVLSLKVTTGSDFKKFRCYVCVTDNNIYARYIGDIFTLQRRNRNKAFETAISKFRDVCRNVHTIPPPAYSTGMIANTTLHLLNEIPQTR